ncbi:MAG: hypothetical protein FWC20_11170 [Oscillospiraceae bacterium]|nr:hypothetical protein [Oscillospiraceae bacterium]MCL2279948.1 hypothetical protein [Oscillospiraceae bacterium]
MRRDIKRDHTIIGDVPVCAAVGNDYYTLNSQVVHGQKELGNYIADRLREGKKEFVVKLANAHGKGGIEGKVLKIASEKYSRKSLFGGYSIESSSNLSQMVFEIRFR